MYWTVIKYGVPLALGLSMGWLINGWRLEANIASLKASYAEAIATQYQGARNREKRLLEASEAIKKERDDKVKNLNGRLDAALGELRQRKERDSRNPTDTASCSGATGAELSRPDAEFLAREASRADKVVSDLNYCIQRYNSVKDTLNATN